MFTFPNQAEGGSIMKCGQCKMEKEELWEFCDVNGCYDCLLEYWRDEDMGMNESFEDFLNYTCTKVVKKC